MARRAGRDGGGNTAYLKGKGRMNVSLVLKMAGIGLIVSVAHQILSKSGRDEQAMLVTVAGVVIAMLMLTGEIASLLQSIRNAFGI